MASEEVTEAAEAVSEAANVIEKGVEAVASQIAELAATYGEPAWNTVLLITQIEAASDLLRAAVFAGVAVWFLSKAHLPGGWFWSSIAAAREHRNKKAEAQRVSKEWRDADKAEDWACGRITLLSIATLPAIVCAAVYVAMLLNIWNWIALFSPQLYLAKRALDAVVGL